MSKEFPLDEAKVERLSNYLLHEVCPVLENLLIYVSEVSRQVEDDNSNVGPYLFDKLVSVAEELEGLHRHSRNLRRLIRDL
jgi:hypothetical protein